VAPLIVAHRGGAPHLGENTAAAFEAGVASGADMLECDIRRSRDGALVLIHDERVVLPGRGLTRVDRASYAELRQAFPDLLTLPEYLAMFGSRVPTNLDIKQAGREREIVDLLQHRGLIDQMLISSTSWWTLRRVRALAPALRTGLSRGQFVSWVGSEARSRRAARFMRPLLALVLPGHRALAGSRAVMLQYRLATPRFVRHLNRFGIDVFVWTVDFPEIARRVARAGVTGIATNRPDRIIPALRRDQPGRPNAAP
jgi:glycerophosphoryl diester phosphodiesterase